MADTTTTRRPRSLLTRKARRELLAAKVADAIVWMREAGASSVTLACGYTIVVEHDLKVWIREGGITGRSLGCFTDFEAPQVIALAPNAYRSIV